MTYNSILDAWFGSGLISYLAPLVILLVMSIYIAHQKKKGRKFNIVFLGLIYAVPIFLFLTAGIFNPLFLGYGHPVAITSLMQDNSKLYICDYLLTTGSKTSDGQKCFRLHVLNSKTGEKIVRFPIGDVPNFILAHGDSVSVYHSNEITTYSNITGKKLVEYSKETLPNLFPELKLGIDGFSAYEYNGIITFQTLDGTKWHLNIVSHSLKIDSELKKEPYHSTNDYYIDNETILIDSKAGGEYYIELKSKNDSEHQKYIFQKRENLWFGDTYFIDGKPIYVNKENNCFIVKHYENIKQEQFYLTALSLNKEQKLWDIKESDLNSTFKHNDFQYTFFSTDTEDNSIIFNIGNEVYALNINDGKLVWETSF